MKLESHGGNQHLHEPHAEGGNATAYHWRACTLLAELLMLWRCRASEDPPYRVATVFAVGSYPDILARG